MTYEAAAGSKARRAVLRLKSKQLRARSVEQRAVLAGLLPEFDLIMNAAAAAALRTSSNPRAGSESGDWAVGGQATETGDTAGWAPDLHAAVACARERFSAVQDAYAAVEDAHERGDFSRSSEFEQRLDEFRTASSEVRRLTTEFRSEGSGADEGPAFP